MKFWHKDSAVIPLSEKYDLTILAFPLNRFEKKGTMIITSGHILLGKESDKQAYIKEITANKRYENVEVEGSLVVYSIRAKKGSSHLQMYLSPEVIFVKPIVVKPDGFEYFEVGALEKKVLTEFLDIAQKWGKVEMQRISKEKVRDLYVPHVMPDLTEKQLQAITLAYKNGFYVYPRQTEIKRLAKIAGLSPSTFQEHLHKAEHKLIPFFLENIIHKG